MAFDFSKLNFLNRLDARSRVFVLFGSIIGMIILIYVLTQYFSNRVGALGPSQVANAPTHLKSIPGGTLTTEYSKALQQANVQAAERAKMTGGSAVPTLVNYGIQQTAPSSSSGCMICSTEHPEVKTLLDNWASHGNIAPDVADTLGGLAKNNVSVSEYSTKLAELVKAGKLTPEQARELLQQYEKQHASALLDESATMMDQLIKSGKLPIDVANQLLAAQKAHMSPEDYAATLDRLVREGKISPEVARELLAQYQKQFTREVVQDSLVILHQMAVSGQLLPEIEKELIVLENTLVPVDVFSATLNKYMKAGRMVPTVANKILDEYKSQKARIGSVANVGNLIKKAEQDASDEIRDLLRAGKITPEVGDELTAMIQQHVSLDQFTATLKQLVQSGKLTPEIAKLKLEDYKKIISLRILAQRLEGLQVNNASDADYAKALREAVQTNDMTPEDAAQLLRAYQISSPKTAYLATGEGPTTAAFSALSARAAEGAATTQGGVTTAVPEQQFIAAKTAGIQSQTVEEQTNISTLATAMSGQAAQLVASWQPVVMTHRAGAPQSATDSTQSTTGRTAGTTTSTSASTTGVPISPPVIKAGTISFAVLDTTANSDYPDSPVMATLVDGPFKGAILLGKLVTSKGPTGQLDRIALNFTLMNLEVWPQSKAVTAYAIDPDTARTVLASSVDNHYLQRFGAVMATSFLQGYSSSITQAGTSTTGIFGTSTTHPSLSPGQQIAVGLGQVGQTLGTITSNYVNIPPTVKVDAGVGLGILFMVDVT